MIPVADSTLASTGSPTHNVPNTMVSPHDKHENLKRQIDDPATMATSEELKHTKISDHNITITRKESLQTSEPLSDEEEEIATAAREKTPSLSASNTHTEGAKEVSLSPKKKRCRDQDEEPLKYANSDEDSDKPDSTDGSVEHNNRTTRLEPEKKRPRDASSDPSICSESSTVAKHAPLCGTALTDYSEKTPDTQIKELKTESNPINDESSSNKPKTCTPSFANSGFASLAASTTSPFGSMAGTKPSIFRVSSDSGPSSETNSISNAKPSNLTTATNGGFGGFSNDKPSIGFGFGSGAVSGFACLANGSVFGSKAGTGFAGNIGPRLSSFAAPGTESNPLVKGPVKAFGAPEIEETDGSECDSNSGCDGSEDEESTHFGSEEKKKSKISKICINDGEAGEATILQIRARLFALESKEAGWKERGVGTLKVNVPKSCVRYDEKGVPVPGSYQASGFEAGNKDLETSRVARLIMRQENTHRVVLNTIILRAMEFEDKPAVSSTQLVFTAVEGEKELKPIKMLLKMSEANAKLFKSEVNSIQREL